MQRSVIVAGQLPDLFRDGVCSAFVVVPGADVIERPTGAILQHHDVFRPELDRRQAIVGLQPMETSRVNIRFTGISGGSE